MARFNLEPMELLGEVRFAAADSAPGSLPKIDVFAYSGGTCYLPSMVNALPADHPLMQLRDRIVIDLASMSAPASVSIRRNHDGGRVVGHGQPANDGQSLVVNGVVSGTGPDAVEVVANHANGFPWQASVGISGGYAEILENATLNGRLFRGTIAAIFGCRLNEVSIVDKGADSNTGIRIAAKEDNAMPETLPAVADPKPAAQPLPSGPVALNGFEVMAALDAQQELTTDVRKRLAADAAAGKFASLDALNFAASTEAIAILRSKIPAASAAPRHAPNVCAPENPGWNRELIEAAFAMGAGLGEANGYSPDVLEKASKKARNEFGRDMGLSDMLCFAANQQSPGTSFRTIGKGNVGRVLDLAFASSTADIPNILANVANKRLVEAYIAEADDVAMTLSAINPNMRDFRQHSDVARYGDLELLVVPEGGAVEHGKITDLNYTYTALTYARAIHLTRQALMNDDIGALTNMAQAFGQGAADAFNRKWWGVFNGLLAATFFDAANLNVTTGALSLATLNTAVKVLRAQKTPAVNSRRTLLNLKGAYLLVPPALEATADSIYTSTNLNNGATSDNPTANPHVKKYKPLVSSYLSDSDHGNSDIVWYLFADPKRTAAMTVGFVQGQTQPVAEQAVNVDGTIGGARMMIYHDFAVASREKVSAVRSTGA